MQGTIEEKKTTQKTKFNYKKNPNKTKADQKW